MHSHEKTAKFVKKAREISKLKQREFGAKIGISQAGVAMLENAYSGPSGYIILKIIELVKGISKRKVNELIDII